MIEISHLTKSFQNGNLVFNALSNVSITIPDNKLIFLSGESGSGKTTLLSIIGLLQKPTSGQVIISNEIINYDSDNYTRRRLKDTISLVFQEFNLLDDFSVIDNLKIVCDDDALVMKIIKKIRLENKINTPTKFLSGGEKQRLAIGRALAKGGDIILLDEPTGSLDAENSTIIFTLLKEISISKTVIVASHDLASAYFYGDQIIFLKSGKIDHEVDLSVKDYEIDFPQKGFSAFDLILDIIRYKQQNDNFVFTCTCDSQKKSFIASKENYLSVLYDIYQVYRNSKIKIQILTNKNEETFTLDKGKKVTMFKNKHVFMYSLFLLKNKIGRNIISIILLIINIILVFTTSSVIAFDQSQAIFNALNNNDVNFSRVYRLENNAPTNEIKTSFTGEKIYNSLLNADIEPISYIFSNSDIHNLNLIVAIIDQPVAFYGKEVAVPSENCISVTSFVHYFMDSEIINISFNSDGFYGDAALTLGSIIDIDYQVADVEALQNNSNFENENEDLFYTKYGVAFISRLTLNNLKDTATNNLPASNFFISGFNTKAYAEAAVKYANYNNNNLIKGHKPTAINEVVVSSNFLLDNQNYIDDLDNVVGQTVQFKDLNASPNFVLYQSVINLYDIQSELVITGITDDNNSGIYVDSSFYSQLNVKRDKYLSGYVISANIPKTQIQRMLKEKMFFALKIVEPVLSINIMVNSDFFMVLIAVEVALLLITILYLIISCGTNVKEKYREMSILKSLGISNRRIYSIFILLNTYVALIASLLGLILARIGLHFFNLVMMSPSVFNINYALFSANIAIYFFIILLIVGISLLTTLTAFFKIKKIDIAVALRMF